MSFLLLIVETRGMRQANDPETAHRLYAEMVAYGQELKDQGLLLASESLRPDEHGVRIGRHDGKPQLRDGPFAEAREMVGGFFLIDANNRDEAVAIAQRCPALAWATVEVRECAPCYLK